MSHLSDRLKKARKEKGFTLEKLANSIGSSKSYLWQIENGQKTNPSFDMILKISKVLDIPIDYFACENDSLQSKGQKGSNLLTQIDKLDSTSKQIIENLIKHLIVISRK